MEQEGRGRPRWLGEAVVLLALLTGAAALRFYGLTWGLPNSLHDYSYHPDEFLLIGTALFVLQSFIPAFYNYPSLYIYLAALAVLVGSAYGVVNTPADTYLAARVVTAAMGIGAVAAIYWAGKSAYGRAVALAAAIVLAVAPLHVQHSHFATVDVPSTLLIALALGFTALIIRRGSWRDYILAGVMSGLAAGTKYNAGLVLLSPLAAHFVRVEPATAPGRWTRPLVMAGCAAAAFVISTPGAILRWDQFTHGLLYELRHSAEGHGLVFAGTGNGLVYTFASSLWYGLGPRLTVLFVLAIIHTVARRDRFGLAMLAFAVPYIVLISLSEVRFARYTLPLFPAVAVLCGWLIVDVWVHIRTTNVRTLRAAVAAVVAIVWGTTVSLTFARVVEFGGPDPRDRAAEWISKNISSGSSIGVMDVPWFYSPPFSSNIGFGTLPQREQATADAPYDIVVFSQCVEQGCWWSETSHLRWVVLSSYEVQDALRLRGARDLSPEQAAEVRRILRDVDLVDRHYRERARFGSATPGNLPHDMDYVSPEITIYEVRR